MLFVTLKKFFDNLFFSLHAYGLIDGSSCDIVLSLCDPYVKLYIDDVQVLQTAAQEDLCCYNVDTRFVSKKISKSSKIRIEVWDDDSGFLGSPDDLILQTEGDIDSFRDEPVRHGSTFMGQYTTSIEMTLTWQDEYE